MVSRLGLGLLGLSLTGPAAAAVIEQESREWYEVRPAAGTPLLTTLSAASPLREGGDRVFHAYTYWEVSWSFGWKLSRGGACELADVRTRLSVKMMLPRLAYGSSSTAPALSEEFARLFAVLLDHEDGHKAIAQQAAREVDRALSSFAPAPHCESLETQAHERAQALVAAARQREVEFDLASNQGCGHGVCLGPQRRRR